MESHSLQPSEESLDIAVIGMAGRFPGAWNIDEYWENLCSAVESIRFFSDEELIAAGNPQALVNHPNYVKAAPVIGGAELFDAAFFGYSPREARFIDPQQRLFLECAHEALAHAGYDAENYGGRIGVFGGSAINTYLLFSGLLPHFTTEYVLTLTGSDKDFLATRVSYKLDLTGPSVTIQSACSTSLVAVHFGCQSLLNGECEMALVGGVSVKVPQISGYFYEDGGIFTPDGHCRPFDADGKGTIFGSGVGLLVIKRLQDAVRDGDFVHAVIKGSAINNDGAAKANYTAPSVERQAAAIAEAIGNAGISAETISYVETHGTGTILGDPIEIAALTKAFQAYTGKTGFCAIGSVKSNIGHLDAAAGIAGVIKTILALKHKLIPPTLHYQRPNPEIDFANSPFYVNASLAAWETATYPRRASVNGLGVGGTNAHLILEEGPPRAASLESRPYHLLLLSDKTATALETATEHLHNHLNRGADLNMADAAYTLQVGRKPFHHRRAVVCRNRETAMTSLRTLDPRSVLTNQSKPVNREIVFMFPGQSSQYVNMGRALYETEPRYREVIDTCTEILRPQLALSLRDILYPKSSEVEKSARMLDQTYLTQPALFAVEYALARLWMSWGVQPQAMIGHSIGEYVAACLAGVLSLDEALWLVALRGQLLQELPEGRMLSVPLSEPETRPYLNDTLSLAAVNGPALCVVAGAPESVRELEKKLAQKHLRCRLLNTSRAFHSPLVDPILGAFTRSVAGTRLNAPLIPYLSNVTGTWITSAEAVSPSYWAAHLRQTVRFAEGVEELLSHSDKVMLEVGAGQSLGSFVRLQLDKTRAHLVLASLRHRDDDCSDVNFLLTTLGRLWASGTDVDWQQFNAGARRLRVPMPGYPFERQRYWIDKDDLAAENGKSDSPRLNQAQPQACMPALPPTLPEKSVDAGVAETTSHPASPAGGQQSRPARPSPRTPIEVVVAGVWKEILGLDQVGVDENFFELGGHSLLIPPIVTRLNRLFLIDLPMLTVLESPTIAELALCIERIFQITQSAAGYGE